MAMASIKRNFIFDLLNNITGLLFPLMTFPYISRILNPEGIGEVAFAQSIISYFVMVAALGIPTYALREVAKLKNDHDKLSSFTFEIFTIHAILSVIAYLVALSFVLIGRINEIWITYVITSTHIILNFLGFSWFFQGVEEFRFIAIRVLIFRILSLIALFLFVRESTDVYWYVTILVVSEAGNNICNVFKLRKYVSFKKVRIKWTNLRKHINPIVSLFLLSVSTMIYFNMDNLMIGFIKDDVSVGYYNPALRIQRLLMGFVLSLSTVLFPRLSSLASTDKKTFFSLGRQGITVTLGLSIPISFGLYALGEPLILLFAGEQFTPSILTLYFLAPVIILGTCSNLFAKILISQEKENMVLIATSVGAIVNLLLNALLIYYFAQYGAAVASSISELSVLITMIIVGHCYLPKSLFSKDVFKYLLASVVMFASIFFLYRILLINDVLTKCLIVFVSGTCVYGLSLIMLKESIFVPKLKMIVFSKWMNR